MTLRHFFYLVIMSATFIRRKELLPKQTFFNLSSEKRQTLIQAAKTEFTRVSLYEASIANIVKEAEIPRGSFYQYFEDKDDLYFYLLEKQGEDQWQKFFQILHENDGDYFVSLIKLYEIILISTDDEEERNFYRNVFLNMNYRTEETFNYNINYEKSRKKFNQIKDVIQTDTLNISNEDDLFHIIQITTTLMFQNIIIKFAHKLTNEEAFRNYQQQLALLKKGFVKK